MGNLAQEQGDSNFRQNDRSDKSCSDGHSRLVQSNSVQCLEESISNNPHQHQKRGSGIGSSSLGSNTQPLVEVHNRHPVAVVGGDRDFKAVFGCRKTFSGKYIFSGNANFRKRKIFPRVWLHFRKFSGKYFLMFGKEEGKDKPKKNIINDRDPRLRSRRRDLAISVEGEIAINCAISRRREIAPSIARSRSRSKARSRSTRREIVPSIAISIEGEIAISRRSSDWRSAPRARSLSLSLFFRKCFEVKMRGENYFRVKGENISQPEVIFPKILFSVTAKLRRIRVDHSRKEDCGFQGNGFESYGEPSHIEMDSDSNTN